jgi:AraC-like DNA-binding protein
VPDRGDAGRWSQEVRGYLLDGVLVESYGYPRGPAGAVAGHAHDEYHVCVNGSEPGEYRYRGGWHLVPPGALTVIMADQAHSLRELADRERTARFTVLYPSSALMRRFAAELGGVRAGAPFFPAPVIADDELTARLAGLPEVLHGSRLARDEFVLSVLIDLLARHGAIHGAGRRPARSRSVDVVRTYLHDNDASDVSLTELAALAGLSSYHLSRMFREQIGLPPHAYQLQMRIARAKRLLLRGLPVSRVAQETGFFDLSHFTRHFKRVVGVPPGAYRR